MDNPTLGASAPRRPDRVALVAEIATRLLDADGDRMAGQVLADLAAPLRIDLLLRYRVGQAGSALELVGHAGLPAEMLPALQRLGWGEGVCGRSAAERRTLTVSRIQSSRDPLLQGLRGLGIRAYSCYPLLSNGELLGTVSFGSTSTDVFPARALTLMRAVANLLAVAAGRHKAERELRESEARYRWILENAREGFYRRDLATGKYDYLSPAVASVLGFPLDELAAMTVDEVVERMHPADMPNVQRAVQEASRTGRLHVEYRFRRKDGEIRWIEDTATVVRQPDGSGYRGGVVRDITERKVAEAADRERRRWAEQLELALDSAQQGTWEFDPAKGDLNWGRRAALLFGLPSPGRMPIERVMSLIPEDERGAVAAAAEKALDPSGDGLFRVEHRVVWPDGSVHWVVARGQAYFEGAGERRRAARFAGIVMDVTDRHEVEDALRETTRRLAEANRLKDEFLATLSHELRTPLNAVLGWSKILATTSPDPATAKRGMEAIARNAEAQAQLVADVLDVSRIVSGKLRLHVRQADLAEVLQAALESVMPAAAAKGVRVETRIAPGSTLVTGDPDRLQQALWNLLSNAVKFTPSGGLVTATVERSESQLVVEVADTGAGIEPEFLPHVFERFTQADTSTRRMHGGLGLGLALVRHLVELHGGTVEAESEGSGAGAAFRIRLPVRAVAESAEEAREPAPPESEAEEATSLEDLRVLVVDDQPDARDLVAEVLGQRGARVVAASSVEEAMEKLGDGDFDVMLADIGMPGEDGYELIRKVRLAPDPRLFELPAAALTAYSRAEDSAQARAAGFDLHLAKPVTPAALVATVRRLADEGRSAGA